MAASESEREQVGDQAGHGPWPRTILVAMEVGERVNTFKVDWQLDVD